MVTETLSPLMWLQIIINKARIRYRRNVSQCHGTCTLSLPAVRLPYLYPFYRISRGTEANNFIPYSAATVPRSIAILSRSYRTRIQKYHLPGTVLLPYPNLWLPYQSGQRNASRAVPAIDNDQPLSATTSRREDARHSDSTTSTRFVVCNEIDYYYYY